MSFLSIAPYAAERINHDSAELLFLSALCKGETKKAAAFFEDVQQFGGPSVVDAPQGRYAGKDEIVYFVQKWLSDFEAVSAEAEPVTQAVFKS